MDSRTEQTIWRLRNRASNMIKRKRGECEAHAGKRPHNVAREVTGARYRCWARHRNSKVVTNTMWGLEQVWAVDKMETTADVEGGEGRQGVHECACTSQAPFRIGQLACARGYVLTSKRQATTWLQGGGLTSLRLPALNLLTHITCQGPCYTCSCRKGRACYMAWACLPAHPGTMSYATKSVAQCCS